MIADLGAKALTLLPPETAHGLSLKALAAGLGPTLRSEADARLACSLAGVDLAHPVGLAAGYDKNAEAPDALIRAGFSFVEVGAVTPKPQPGNPRPRLFRLRGERAVINRMGFNNAGLEAVKRRLQVRKASGGAGVVGVNLGANKDSEDRAGDYATCLAELRGLADFFTVNVSSPNTPGLRGLQHADEIDRLLRRVVEVRWAEPVFLKIAPDLGPGDLETLVAAAKRHALAGLIVSNTTVSRDGVSGARADQAGGLSGRPLFERSTALLREARRIAGPDMALIGVGGVDSAETAYAKIRAGANVVQLYTALVYQGPSLIGRIRDGLAELLRRDGFASVREAVGADL